MGERDREEVMVQCFDFVRGLARNCKGCPRRNTPICGERCVCWGAQRIISVMEERESAECNTWGSIAEHVAARRRRILDFLREQEGWVLKRDLLVFCDMKLYNLHVDLAWLKMNGFIDSEKNGRTPYVRITTKGKGGGCEC